MCLFVLLSCLAFLIYVIDAQLCVSVYLCLWVISTLGMYCSCSNVFFFVRSSVLLISGCLLFVLIFVFVRSYVLVDSWACCILLNCLCCDSSCVIFELWVYNWGQLCVLHLSMSILISVY